MGIGASHALQLMSAGKGISGPVITAAYTACVKPPAHPGKAAFHARFVAANELSTGQGMRQANEGLLRSFNRAITSMGCKPGGISSTIK